jgi:UDPglucose--hexose-1-phosphate uridylyltransferase
MFNLSSPSNRFGDHFGPTVAHPHGQILGLPFVPRRLRISGQPCVLCSNTDSSELFVKVSAEAVLLVSPWARLPFELIAQPLRHVSRLIDLTPSELEAVVGLSQLGLRLSASRYGTTPPYLLNFMQGPKIDEDTHHLRVEIVPLHKGSGTLKRPGAMEVGLGVYTPTRPKLAP